MYLTKRPSYCDRGHYQLGVDGILDIDGADMFPRYYMSLGRAVEEAESWLRWRLSKNAFVENVDLKTYAGRVVHLP